jgi:hypothetical protein
MRKSRRVTNIARVNISQTVSNIEPSRRATTTMVQADTTTHSPSIVPTQAAQGRADEM